MKYYEWLGDQPCSVDIIFDDRFPSGGHEDGTAHTGLGPEVHRNLRRRRPADCRFHTGFGRGLGCLSDIANVSRARGSRRGTVSAFSAAACRWDWGDPVLSHREHSAPHSLRAPAAEESAGPFDPVILDRERIAEERLFLTVEGCRVVIRDDLKCAMERAHRIIGRCHEILVL
jgi:hypothetical protein